MVALLTSVRNSPCFGGLRRTKTCHRQLFARPSRKFAPFGTAHFVCFFRRSAASFPAAMPPFWLACGNRPPPCGGLFPTFCKVQKVGQKNFETFLSESCPFRGSTLRVLLRRPAAAFIPPCCPPNCGVSSWWWSCQTRDSAALSCAPPCSPVNSG